MRRVADFIVRNWPLKLAAILLATVLYSGLVLGQNVRTWTGTLPIVTVRPAANAVLLSELDPVTQVRYRAPLDAGVVSPESFRATVDLSQIEAQPGGEPQTVSVSVIAIDPDIDVVDFQPRQVQVSLDPVATREVPVDVELASVPEGLNIGPEQVEPSSVAVRGASSRVEAVASVVARVAIDASALNVDRDVELTALDSDGNQVPNVVVEPERARVRIAVARELANRTLPIVPSIVGQPAPGYRITSVTVEPLVVTVSGEASTVSQLETADTEPIDISGRSRDLEATVRVALPGGVSVAGNDTVRVVVTFAEDTGTRSFVIGVQPSGDPAALSYEVNTDTVTVTLGGPIPTLDAIDPTQLLATVDVSALDTTGQYELPVDFGAPDGLELVAVQPQTVSVSAVNLSPSIPSP